MPEHDRGRPGEEAASKLSNGDSLSVQPATDAVADWLVVFEAESVVGREWRAQQALRRLSVEQLHDLGWVGLLDDGWSRLVAELRRRGERL
jgi:hypothetical protein